MRDIKFRGWDTNKKLMSNFPMLRYPETVDINEQISCSQKNGIVLMQFTGLRDKNGKEIYEGDICKYAVFDREDSDTHFIGVVNWLGTEFIITQIPDTFSNDEYGMGLGWVHNQYDEMEIIGNIYENPELLK